MNGAIIIKICPCEHIVFRDPSQKIRLYTPTRNRADSKKPKFDFLSQKASDDTQIRQGEESVMHWRHVCHQTQLRCVQQCPATFGRGNARYA